MFPRLTATEFIALVALVIVGALAHSMLYVAVPSQNHDFMVFVLGALSGALTVGAGIKSSENHTKPAPTDNDSPPP
jgi:hypothetical protein